MEKETKKKKSLTKKILIGIGITGVSILAIRAMMRSNHKKNGCVATETAVRPVETPMKKDVHKPTSKDEAKAERLKKLFKAARELSDRLYIVEEIILLDCRNLSFPMSIITGT